MDSTQKEKMTQVADPHNAPDMNPYKTTESFPCMARETTQPGSRKQKWKKKKRREERDLKYNSSFRSSSLPTDPQNDNGYRY